MNENSKKQLQEFKRTVESIYQGLNKLVFAVSGNNVTASLSKDEKQLRELVPAMIFQMRRDPIFAHIIMAAAMGFKPERQAPHFKELSDALQNMPASESAMFLANSKDMTVLQIKGNQNEIIQSLASAMRKSEVVKQIFQDALEIESDRNSPFGRDPRRHTPFINFN